LTRAGCAPTPGAFYSVRVRRRVLLVGYRDAYGLDLFGPAEVFSEAVLRHGAPIYEVVMSAIGGGTMTLTSGITVTVADLASVRPQPSDIVIVAGGSDEATDAAARDRALLGWLARASRTVGRMGSVCDGAFILASAGILDGKRAATHWMSCERLARMYPRINVDREAIFVRDGRVWTAAGVSTGIDMALAMVEEDLGRKLADTVAAHLVLFARRPGFQSQFSEELVAQTQASDPLGPVITWMRANLRSPLDVATVAHRADLPPELHGGAGSDSGQARREAPGGARALPADDHPARDEGHRGAVRIRIDPPDEPGVSACARRNTRSVPNDVLQGVGTDAELWERFPSLTRRGRAARRAVAGGPTRSELATAFAAPVQLSARARRGPRAPSWSDP